MISVTESGKALIIIRQAEQFEKAIGSDPVQLAHGFLSTARNWNALLGQTQGLFEGKVEFASSIRHLAKYPEVSDFDHNFARLQQVKQDLSVLKGSVLAYFDLSNAEGGEKS